MTTFRKILPCALLTFLTASTVLVYGKDAKKKSVKKQPSITLGLNAGKEIALSPISFKIPNKQLATRKSFFLAKTINTHFKFETGLAYTTYSLTSKSLTDHSFSDRLDKISIPVSVQYHFATKCKLHPYCGAGIQYNMTLPENKVHTDVFKTQDQLQQNYTSLLLTQGLILDINPKLQVQESFHFTTDDNSRVFGIDLGVGYTIQ